MLCKSFMLRMLSAFLLLATPFLATTLTARAASAQMMEGVAAIVNDEVITTYDVRQRVRLILSSSGVRPTPELLQRVQAQALRGLIDERIQLQEAAEFDIQVSDQEIIQALDRLARQNNVSADSIARDLAQFGVSMNTLEDQLRAEIAWRSLMSGLYGSRVRVSDDQIDQALERMASSAQKDQYLVGEILVEPRMTAQGDQTGQIVRFVYDQLQQSQGQAFSGLARQISASASAVNGGDVGWISASELRHTEVARELSQMQPGSISRPIQTRDGIYIMLLRDIRRGSELERVRLNQVLLPVTRGGEDSDAEDAARRLNRATRRIRSCDNMDRVKRDLPNAIISDLGAVAPSDLAGEIRTAVDGLEEGETTDALTVPAGAVALTLCERVDVAPDTLPSRDEVENQLLDQQISLLSRRYLRNLLDSATIETRLR